MNYWLFIFLITVLFIFYIEYSVGDILFRQNSLGKISLNIKSLINFMIHPLYNKFLWNIQLLDINYPFILIVSSIIYNMFNTI